MKRIALLIFISILGALQPAYAANRDVCGGCTYTNISSALTAAVSGDTVRVAAGTYTSWLNDLSISGTNMTLTIEGGYDDTFSTRTGETILTAVGIQISPFFSGAVTIDKFTITGQTGNAVYFASTAGSLTLKNCHIYNNTQAAVMVRPYNPNASGDATWAQQTTSTFLITNNVVHDNAGYGAIDITLNTPDAFPTSIEITDNVTYDTAGQYSSGISVTHFGNNSSILISRNESYENQAGVFVQLAGANTQLEVSNNILHNNRSAGLRIYGSPTAADTLSVHHNLVYSNTTWGIYHLNPRTSSYLNNTIAFHDKGMQLISNSGSPRIRNNIFYDSGYAGLMISSDDRGYGGTGMIPESLRYNNFYNPTKSGSFLHTGLPPAYSYHEEAPGEWDAFNQWSWTVGNFSEDPRFVDAANGDFHLRTDSFCLDEGDAGDSFGNEASPNGGRINLGAYGDSAESEITPDPVNISNLNVLQSGAGVQLNFNTTTSVHSSWLTAEYFDGTGYQQIDPTLISGANYQVGYLTGRLRNGSGRLLTWTGAGAVFPQMERSNIKLRLTTFHGNQSHTVESAPFAVDFKPPTVRVTAPADGTFISADKVIYSAAAADSGSGIGAVVFTYKKKGGANFIPLGTDSSAPYVAPWGNLLLTPGATYIFRATAIDRANQSTHSAEVTASVCSYNLPVASAQRPASGGPASFLVKTPGSTCTWSARSNVSWITLTTSAGSGSGSVVYKLSKNTTDKPRSGMVTLRGKSFIITQTR